MSGWPSRGEVGASAGAGAAGRNCRSAAKSAGRTKPPAASVKIPSEPSPDEKIIISAIQAGLERWNAFGFSRRKVAAEFEMAG